MNRTEREFEGEKESENGTALNVFLNKKVASLSLPRKPITYNVEIHYSFYLSLSHTHTQI